MERTAPIGSRLPLPSTCEASVTSRALQRAAATMLTAVVRGTQFFRLRTIAA